MRAGATAISSSGSGPVRRWAHARPHVRECTGSGLTSKRPAAAGLEVRAPVSPTRCCLTHPAPQEPGGSDGGRASGINFETRPLAGRLGRARIAHRPSDSCGGPGLLAATVQVKALGPSVPIPQCRPELRHSAGSPAMRNFAGGTLWRASVRPRTSPSKSSRSPTTVVAPT
jgi:hypothetical protein